MGANEDQFGGTHYKGKEVEPWDIVVMYDLDYFEGSALKYLLRRKDNRVMDLQKAIHFLRKKLELMQDVLE